jgi:hypothetical protein
MSRKKCTIFENIFNQITMKLSDRLLEVINDRFESQSNFSVKLKVTRQSVHSTLKNGSPSVDFLTKLHMLVPDLNMNWLLFGEGDKYLSRDELLYTMVKEKMIGYDVNERNVVELLKDDVTHLRETVSFLQRIIEEKNQ